MKKFFALPLAAVFIAACSDSSTAPSATADLSPSYGKPIAPVVPCAGCGLLANYDFESGVIVAASGTSVVTEIQPGAQGTASDADVVTSPNGLQKFLGRFENTRTMVVINIPASSNYRVDFDLYTIGSWDGRGKQAQHGVFESNVVDISTRCGTTVSSLFKTTFSNQLTVQQDYPQAYLTGGNKAATNAAATDALGYKDAHSISNTPLFRSFGDVTYAMSFGGAAPAGCAGQPFSLLISTSNPTQQSLYDESWGVDNISIYRN